MSEPERKDRWEDNPKPEVLNRLFQDFFFRHWFQAYCTSKFFVRRHRKGSCRPLQASPTEAGQATLADQSPPASLPATGLQPHHIYSFHFNISSCFPSNLNYYSQLKICFSIKVSFILCNYSAYQADSLAGDSPMSNIKAVNKLTPILTH